MKFQQALFKDEYGNWACRILQDGNEIFFRPCEDLMDALEWGAAAIKGLEMCTFGDPLDFLEALDEDPEFIYDFQ